MVYYREDLLNYCAILGMDAGPDITKVLARYEFHGSHHGWHVHTSCGDVDLIPEGKNSWPGMTRIPSGDGHHRQTDFEIGHESALHKAYQKFGLVKNKLKLDSGSWT